MYIIIIIINTLLINNLCWKGDVKLKLTNCLLINNINMN